MVKFNPVTIGNLSSLKFHSAGSFGETAESCLGIHEGEDFGVVVVGGVHGLEGRIGFQHLDLGFATVIADQLAGNADPLAGCSIKGTELHLGVCLDLLGNVLGLAGLNAQLAVDDFDGAEGADLGSVTIYCCQEIGAALFDEFFYFFHN